MFEGFHCKEISLNKKELAQKSSEIRLLPLEKLQSECVPWSVSGGGDGRCCQVVEEMVDVVRWRRW